MAIGIIIGIFIGTPLGWVLCAMCVASRNGEDNQPRPKNKKGA